MIKFGLRKIFLSYSRISLADICAKLHMDSVAETEYIVAKAIRDGVIDATINHEEQYLQTKVNLSCSLLGSK
ncbi:MAG: PCI domain-containing protein [Candidatus Pacebacteria bacterium]|nr:PCI domain-containing protein [Candidatus Paceibacterota bacterium]